MAYGRTLNTRQLNRAIPHPKFNLSKCEGTGIDVEAWLKAHCSGGFCLGIFQKSDWVFYCNRAIEAGTPPMPKFTEGVMVMDIGPFTIADHIDDARSPDCEYPNGAWIVFDLEADALRCQLKWGK